MEGNQSRQHRPGVPLPNSYTPMLIQSSLCWASAAPSPFQVVQLDCSHLRGCSTPAATVAILELTAALAQCAPVTTGLADSVLSITVFTISPLSLSILFVVSPQDLAVHQQPRSRNLFKASPFKKVLVFLHCRFRAGSLGGNRYL